MLISTFMHLPGIKPDRERKLWEQGIRTWEHFVLNSDKLGLSAGDRDECLRIIRESQRCLDNSEHWYFMNIIPRAESWRLYREFKKDAAFVDIETSGQYGGNAITLIGVYDGRKHKIFVRGDNLLEAEEEIFKYKLLVTYNGTGFDLPMIFDLFPRLRKKHLHIDVMYPLRRLGYKGGLKAVERTLEIKRIPEVENFNGWDAVKLWNEYITNDDKKALELLIKYNREDCKNLKPLVEFAYKNLKKQTFDRCIG